MFTLNHLEWLRGLVSRWMGCPQDRDGMLTVLLCNIKGMLASAEAIETVAQAVQDHKIETLVVDPVSLPCSSAPD